jgi:hypothetical protein
MPDVVPPLSTVLCEMPMSARNFTSCHLQRAMFLFGEMCCILQ